MFNSITFVRNLCRQKNIPISKLEKDLGYGNGYFNAKKQSKLPYNRAVEIARYLSVSPELILTGEDIEKAPTLTEKDRRDIARDLESMMAQLDAGGDMMFDGDPISDEARASIRSALQMGLEIAKVKNKERFTPKKYRKD